MAHPHPDQRQRFEELSSCTLRQVRISNPFWTYCHNFSYGNCDVSSMPPQQLKGSISGSGLFEGYVRIPWHDSVEPEISVPCICQTYGRVTQRGITVRTSDGVLGFCTNRHYVEWWKTQHADSAFDPGRFATPEEFYKAEDRNE